MGLKNSTKTRVEPVFDEIHASHKNIKTWLPRLLNLPIPGGESCNITEIGTLRRLGWGDAEISLPPPRGLLTWLVRHLELVDKKAHLDCSATTRDKRERLHRGDIPTVTEALDLLSREPLLTRVWYVLEGPTWPDVYIETDKVIVVIEGKRTELAPTIGTTWMPVRHQMLRHLDCAWDRREDRQVLGFFIVEGVGGEKAFQHSPEWQSAAAATVSPTILDASLPHRSPTERQAIAECFLGVTTWQCVCDEFKIPWSSLQNTAEKRAGA